MPNSTLDLLDKLGDDELQAVIDRANGLLKQRDDARKAKALNEARALLESVGLSLKDVAAKPGKHSTGKGPVYHGGRRYQHPTEKALIWGAKGQKPGWLRELEAQGGKAIELP